MLMQLDDLALTSSNLLFQPGHLAIDSTIAATLAVVSCPFACLRWLPG